MHWEEAMIHLFVTAKIPPFYRRCSRVASERIRQPPSETWRGTTGK